MTEKEMMEQAGFAWDPTGNARPRWTHPVVGITALREDWMRDDHWLKRCQEKIAEAQGLIPFRDLAIGARFRFRRETDSKRHVYIKLPGIPGSAEFQVIAWTNETAQHVPQDVSGEDARRIVERFEPLGELTPHELAELPNCPNMWESLADYHDNQAAQFHAMGGYPEATRYHDQRGKLFHERAKEITKRWES